MIKMIVNPNPNDDIEKCSQNQSSYYNNYIFKEIYNIIKISSVKNNTVVDDIEIIVDKKNNEKTAEEAMYDLV